MPKIWAGVPEVFDWLVQLIDQTDCRTINANLTPFHQKWTICKKMDKENGLHFVTDITILGF